MEQAPLNFDWPVKMKQMGICDCCRGCGFVEHWAITKEAHRNTCKACRGTGMVLVHKYKRPQ